MGFCSSSTYIATKMSVRRWAGLRILFTHQKGTGHQDDDAAIAGGLGIKGRDLVADLLEGQAL